jgi:hypothetical protein
MLAFLYHQMTTQIKLTGLLKAVTVDFVCLYYRAVFIYSLLPIPRNLQHRALVSVADTPH